MKIKVIQDTVFKQTTEDSSRLPDSDKVGVKAGTVFAIHSWKPLARNHIKIAILGEFLGDPPRNTWCVYQPHVQVMNDRGQGILTQPEPPHATSSLPPTKSLNIPYKSQLDNVFNPRGACNVTSFAMVMAYFRIKGRTNPNQLEDELYQYLESKGLSRWDPQDLAKMGSDYGLKDDFTTRGRLSDVRRAIAEGRPCIIHGYFTSFGHIIVVRGYDRTGLFVNDPFGEWTSSGYLNEASGENLHYSDALVQSKCSPEGEDFIWLHRLSQPRFPWQK